MLARATQAAHDQQVVHRDLKPANVLLADGAAGAPPTPKIADFGLARKLDEASQTMTGSIVGTPSYMAPEQAEGRTAAHGPLVDVYALGGILYECLTGRPPFKAASQVETLRQVMQNQPAPLRQLAPGTPRDLETICLKCLAKEPNRRYASAAALADDLAHYLAGRPVLARPVGSAERLWRWARRNPAVAGLLAAVALSLIAGTIVATSFAIEARRRANDSDKAAAAARQEQLRADENGRAAEASADQARWRAYVSDLQRVGYEWKDGHVDRVRRLLDGQLPERVGGKDLRGPEWHLWDHLCHSELLTFRGHASPVMNLAFSPDGKRIASVAARQGDEPHGKGLKVWEAGSGRILFELPGAEQFAWSPDGRWLASPAEGDTPQEMIIWDGASGREFRRLSIAAPGLGSMYAMAFSPNGNLLAMRGPGGSIRLWEVATGTEIRRLDGHSAQVTGIAFRPDGAQIATCGMDGNVRLWDVATGRCARTIVVAANLELWAIAYHPEGEIVTVGGDRRTFKLFDISTGTENGVFTTPAYSVRGLAFNSDGTMLAAGGADNIVRVWGRDGSQRWQFHGHTGPIRALAFSPNSNTIASAAEDGTVKLWDADAGPFAVACELRATDPNALVPWMTCDRFACAVSPDGRRFALGGADGLVHVHDAESGAEALLLPTNLASYETSPLAFSPDCRTIASLGTNQKQVRLWDAEHGGAAGAGPVHKLSVQKVLFMPDGKRLASVCSRYGGGAALGSATVTVWRVADGLEERSFPVQDVVREAALSPDGKLLATGDFGTPGVGMFRNLPTARVRIWDMSDGRELRSFVAHADSIVALAFSADGRRLASASTDQSVKVWDVETGTELLNLQGHTSPVERVAFNLDGSRLASSAWDPKQSQGETILWELTGGQPVLVLGTSFGAFTPDGQRMVTLGTQVASVWDLTPDTPDHLVQREAVGLFLRQLRRVWLKDELTRTIREDPSVGPEARQRALAMAERYRESPRRLNLESWWAVLADKQSPERYRLALRQAEEAVRREPRNAAYLTTLGVAYFRAARPADAVKALAQVPAPQRDRPVPLAFLAMAQKQLGQHECEATLKRLEDVMKRPDAFREWEVAPPAAAGPGSDPGRQGSSLASRVLPRCWPIRQSRKGERPWAGMAAGEGRGFAGDVSRQIGHDRLANGPAERSRARQPAAGDGGLDRRH